MAALMTFGSLFAGIGGFDLGLERAGMECRWQVENNPYSVRVLEKHWPDVKRYGDITQLDGSELEPVDLICGGFPCQDISCAGKGGGITAARSGLWRDFARLVAAVRPAWVLVENSPSLRGRGLAVVLQDLWSLGFDAEWHCIPACDFGAPYERDRIYVLAYAGADSNGCDGWTRTSTETRRSETSPGREPCGSLQNASVESNGRGSRRTRRSDPGSEGEREPSFSAADADGSGWRSAGSVRPGETPGTRACGRFARPGAFRGAAITNFDRARLQVRQNEARAAAFAATQRNSPANPDGEPLVRTAIARGERHAWTVEPGVVRMAARIPKRVDRIRGLGNAVIPQVAEWLGRRILEARG